MNARVQNVLDAARRLSEAEQLELAELLVAGVPGSAEIDATWLAEAEKRWSEHQASGEPTFDALEVVDEARARLAKRRPK